MLIALGILGLFLIMLGISWWFGSEAPDRDVVQDGHGQSHEDYSRRGK